MSFLRDLQGFKDELVKAEIKVGFLIAGSLEWEPIIVRDPSLTGSIERKEHMPPVTPELAGQMINKRLLAFSHDKTRFNPISAAFIKQVYRKLENEKKSISYRSFIEAAYEQFLKKNFSVLDKPLEMDSETISKIKEIIEGGEVLRKRFNNFVYGRKIEKAENRAKSLKLLIRLFLEGPIKDSSALIAENRFYFQKLSESNLIVKTKIGNELGWQACSELIAANKTVLDRLNVSLEDYLLQLYGSLSKKAPLTTTDELAPFRGFVHKIREQKIEIKSLMERSLEAYARSRTELSNVGTDFDTGFLRNCWASFEDISRAFFFAEGAIPAEVVKTKQVRDLWLKYWYLPGIVDEYLSLSKDSPASDRDARLACERFREAYEEIFEKIRDHLEKEETFPLTLSGLTSEEVALAIECRSYWFQGNYYKVIKKLNEKTQRKFRLFLFNVFTALYGPSRDKRLLRVESSVVSYIKNNIAQTPFEVSDSANEFQELNRGNYKKFLTEENKWSNQNWGEVFEHVLGGWSKREFGDFLDKFADTLIVAEHEKEETNLEPSYVYNYLIKTIEFYRKLNAAYSDLLKKNLYRDGNEFYFSFVGYKTNSYDKTGSREKSVHDKKSLEPIIPMKPPLKDELARLNEIMKGELKDNNVMTIDLENRTNSEKELMVSYRAYLFYFAYLCQADRLGSESKDLPRLAPEAIEAVGNNFELILKPRRDL